MLFEYYLLYSTTHNTTENLLRPFTFLTVTKKLRAYKGFDLVLATTLVVVILL